MSGRQNVTRARLDELRLGLSKRDEAILRTLAGYRLASGDQLRRWFFAEHASVSAATRATTGAMLRLRRLGVVDHLTRRVGGQRGGSGTYVWSLSRAGHRLLAMMDREPDRRWPDFDSLSLRTVDHTLAITETAVVLRETERRGELEVIELTPEPACWRTYLNAGGGLATLKPDMFAVTAVPGAEFEDVWFIEVDQGTESLPRIQRKAGVYETYWRTGKEQAAQGTFPQVLWLTPDNTRAERIADALSSTSTGRVRHVAIARERLIELVTVAAAGTMVSSAVSSAAASTDKPAGEAEVRHD